MFNATGMVQLQDCIDALTQKIHAQVIAEEIANISQLISERADYISQLMSHCAADDQAALKRYLTQLKARDEEIIKLLFEQREAVRKTLQSLKKVKAYAAMSRSLP